MSPTAQTQPRPMKDSGVEWIGAVPSHWKVCRIKNLFYEVNERCEQGDEHVLLSVSEYYGVEPRKNRIADDDLLTHAQTLDGYKMCRVGDMVMNIMLAWKMALGYSKYSGIVSPAYCVYRAKVDICVRYYHYLFRTQRYADVFRQNSTGIIDSRLRLYPDKFFALYCQHPPIAEQQRIADYLDRVCGRIDAAIEKLKLTIEKLKAYKLSVITEAVTQGLDPNAEMKDSGVDFVPYIPNERELSRVGYFFDIVLGKMLCSTPKSNSDTLEPYYCAADVHFTGIDSSGERKQMWFSEKEKCDYLVAVGDLLVVEGGAGAGGCAIVDAVPQPTFIQNSILKVSSNSSVKIKFLRYWIESMVLRGYVDYICNKATIPHFTKDKLQNMPFIVFSHEEMLKITSFLDNKCAAIAATIATKESLIAKLTAYKKSLIYELVTGKRAV